MAGCGGTQLSFQLLGRIEVPAGQGIKLDPMSKITKVIGAGGVAEVVKRLPNKCRPRKKKRKIKVNVVAFTV
jgi:hypothetical protein